MIYLQHLRAQFFMYLQLVGPLNVRPAKPLPEDLDAFLRQQNPAQSSQDPPPTPGAVFVSMGTAVRMVEAEILGIAANLAALNRPVLWKLSEAELPGDCKSQRQ